MRHVTPIDYAVYDPTRPRENANFLRPFSWGFVAFTLVLSLYTIWKARLPSMGFMGMWLVFAWAVVGMMFCVRWVARMIGLLRLESAERARVRAEPRNWIVLITTVLTVATWVSGWIQQFSFRVSLSAMNTLAATVSAKPPGTRIPDQWVGLYHATRIEPLPGGCRFVVGPYGFIDSCGYALTNGPKPVSGKTRYIPINSRWSIWIQRF